MRIILLALLAVALPVLAQDELSATAWLEHMSQALGQKQFKVSIIHLQADHIRPLVYLHAKIEGQEVALLEYLNGPPQNAVRVGNIVTFIDHDQPAYSIYASHIQGGWPAALAGNIASLATGYEFVLGGRSRIAGRPAQMVRIISKDSTRYMHQVWIDMESFLPLRYDLMTQNKELIEQLMAIELVILPKTPELLREVSVQQWPEVMSSTGRSDSKNWQFSWLPKGFGIQAKDHHRLIGSDEAVEYIALTDGLVQASVYVTQKKQTPLPEEFVTHNGLSLVSEIKGDFEVVVMGSVPPETLRRIAKGLYLH